MKFDGSKKLSGKVALVTGGARGIGAGIALALAQNGADVGVSFISSATKANAMVAQLQSHGVRAAAFRADQADAAQVADLVQKVFNFFGRLDILVNNAGIAVASPIDSPDFDEEAFARLHAINTTGVLVATRTASRIMHDGGRIISIGSALADRVAFPGLADYAASKAAIVGFSKGAARDLAPKRITVNVVQCGAVDTDMNPENGPTATAQKGLAALARFGRPEEIGSTVAFLASDEASYITGAVLRIDGGLSA